MLIESKPCPMFIELTDSSDGKLFCLNVNFIKTIRNNGRHTQVCTANSYYSVLETYDEIVEKIRRC